MTKETLLFARVGREALPHGLRRQFQVLPLRLAPGRDAGHFNTGVHNFRSLLGSAWNPQAFDLLNIMCALRAADRFFTSKGLYRIRRKISIAVGVTDLARWQKLGPALASAVSALSEDTLDLYPLQLPHTPELATPGAGAPLGLQHDARQVPDCVCLYSGGADSFAGAAYLLQHRRNPILVSHSVGPVSGLQKRLFESLRWRFPALAEESLVQIRAYPNTTKAEREAGSRILYWRVRDQLQRLRSMFFFSIAAIVARAINVTEIFMCENGLIGAAIVFSPRDDNPFTTRPAEPHYLRVMELFLQLALECPHLHIRNPFQYMTKGEVIRYAADLGLTESLYQTVSCWRSGNRGVRNCGQCVPCLFRQLAFDEAGLPPPPAGYRYKHPIPKANWRKWNSPELERLEDIRYYCSQVQAGGISWLLGNELAVVDAIDVTGGPTGSWTLEAIRRRDELAQRKMAKTILRFAQATVERLP